MERGRGRGLESVKLGLREGTFLSQDHRAKRRWGDPRVLSPTPPHILLLSVSQGHALGRVQVSSPKVEVGRTAERTL